MTDAPTGVGRAEALAALSLAIDLGLGLPMEHVLRSSLIASLLAERLGLDDDERAVVHYVNLVLWIGCHADSHEFAHWFGDDLAMRRSSYEYDWAGPAYQLFVLRSVAQGESPTRRAARMLALMSAPHAHMARLIHSHCMSAGTLAARIGLDERVQEGVRAGFERWDGKGLPQGLAGKEIPVATRVAQLAEVVEVHQRTHGTAAAIAMMTARRGTQFDPAMVDVLVEAESALRAVPDADPWKAALADSPDRHRTLSAADLDDLLAAFGEFVDLKTPCTAGHSTSVARLVEVAARECRFAQADVDVVRRAAHVYVIGRMGVPNSVWEKAGGWTESERERARLAPYLTGRILRRVPGLVAIGRVAEAAYERLDGSGYPSGLTAPALDPAQRLLAAAAAYVTAGEPRPHRPALDAAGAAAHLRDEVSAGRLDGTSVAAVLAAAGHRPTRQSRPAGLTEREVEVLVLAARGHSARQIAEQLVISPKTARNHLEHIYTKAGVANRVEATMFAVRHGLIGADRA